ncbi:hypothetical protein ACYRGN_12345 [Listeria kieliensis]
MSRMCLISSPLDVLLCVARGHSSENHEKYWGGWFCLPFSQAKKS